MVRNWLVVLFLLSCELVSPAQSVSKNTYWIKLKDKSGTLYQISHPEAFLSQRAINRRIRQGILIDQTDLPVSQVYLDTLKNRGLDLVHTSKWLNGATVRTADTNLIKKIAALPFVTSVQLTKPATTQKSTVIKFREEMKNDVNPADYGIAITQMTQLNGQYLHNKGFRGNGVQIAVLDAGFWNVNTIAAFDTVRNAKRILGSRDFVDPGSDIYQQHTHGMSVLSCMAGNQPQTLIGTAPDASYYLFRTEDSATEYLIEEDNWVAAAELADSLGVDLINSSLGYSVFDDPKMSHTHSEMNGKTTRITQGANMAFQKGILVFTSAGNEATNSWRHIVVPSDGENVIGVAAVDKLGVWAYFSSIGPAFGGAIKPNVAAMGLLTYLITSSGIPGYSNGTSFSSPVLAGMGACLLQANPYSNVKLIKKAIEQSASLYNQPDSLLGYGIPDFQKADNYLKLNTAVPAILQTSWAVTPNPFNNYLSVSNLNTTAGTNCLITIYNLDGKPLWQSNFKNAQTILLEDLGGLPNGVLILSVRSGGREESFKLVKSNR